MKGRPLLLRYLMYHHGVCGVGGCVGVCVFPGGRERERALCAVPRPRLRLGGPAWSPTAGKKKEKRRKRESCALCHVRALPPFFSPHIFISAPLPPPSPAGRRARPPPSRLPTELGLCKQRARAKTGATAAKQTPAYPHPPEERARRRPPLGPRSLSFSSTRPEPPPTPFHGPPPRILEDGERFLSKAEVAACRDLSSARCTLPTASKCPPRASLFLDRSRPLRHAARKKKKTPHTARLGCPSSPLQDVRALARRRPGGRGRDDGGAQPARPAGVGLAAGKEGGRHMGGARFSLPFSCRPPSSSPLPSLPPPSPGRLPPGPDGRPRPPGSDGASR